MTSIETIRTRGQMQAWSDAVRGRGRSIAVVPTMGAVHDGHLSLVRIGRQAADCVIATIFVNPAQFAPDEDFADYPRRLESDIDSFASAGCACVYCPDNEQMYPQRTVSHIEVSELSGVLEGEFRPHFFGGVTDAVCRLFVHCRPTHAVFGEKDYQQLVIVRRMTRDLGFDIRILAAPTVREINGLAMSSRNAYLSCEEKKGAASLYEALWRAARRISGGQTISRTIDQARQDILTGGFTTVEYVSACNADDLTPLPSDGSLLGGVRGRLLAAARIGSVRLIDNVAIGA